MRIISAVLLALVIPSLAQAQQHFPANEALEAMLEYIVEDGEAPGVVLGVLESDGSTRIVSYGNSGPGARPLGAESRFEIGSITKTFTATLLADMVLKGAVALEDPVAKYLPDNVTIPSRGGREITLLDLATHRSGLPTVPEDFEAPGADTTYEVYTVEDAYAYLSRHELGREPGTAFEYSNFGFALLGHALSRAAGMGYRDMVRTRILEPLGMNETGFEVEGEIAEWMTRGHREGEPVRYRAEMELFDPAGALVSTAGDLLIYMKAQMGPPESDLERAMRLAQEVQVPSGDSGAGQGLAWGTFVQGGEAPIVRHGGGTVGFSARFAFMPSKGIGMVLLANTARFENTIVPTLFFPNPPPATWPRTEVTPAILQDYAGEYESLDGSNTYFVRLEDDGYLTYQPGGNVRARLYATSDSTFYLLRSPWSFAFQRDVAGNATGMLMKVDEREPAQAGLSRAARKVGEEIPPSIDIAGNGESSRAWLAWLILGAVALIGVLGILRWRKMAAVAIALLAPCAASAQHPPVVLPGTEQRALDSSVNGVSYKLYVSLPNDYAASDSEYPVVYLLDADYSFAIARNIVEHISDRGQLERAIIVGIAYGGPPAYRLNRTRDYTPVFSPTGGYGPEYQRVSGGGPAFIEFISDELIPFIEQEYRASDERVLVGHSYGGLFAAWVALNHTRLFSGYIIVSPSLWYDDYMIFAEEEQRAESTADMNAEIYMGVGSLEINSQQNMPDDLARFVAALNSRNYPDLRLDWSIEEDNTHNSIFPIVLSDGLRFLLGNP